MLQWSGRRTSRVSDGSSSTPNHASGSMAARTHAPFAGRRNDHGKSEVRCGVAGRIAARRLLTCRPWSGSRRVCRLKSVGRCSNGQRCPATGDEVIPDAHHSHDSVVCRRQTSRTRQRRRLQEFDYEAVATPVNGQRDGVAVELRQHEAVTAPRVELVASYAAACSAAIGILPEQ